MIRLVNPGKRLGFRIPVSQLGNSTRYWGGGWRVGGGGGVGGGGWVNRLRRWYPEQ